MVPKQALPALARLSDADRLFVAEALLVHRYVGHSLKRGALPSNDSVAAAGRALRMAKRLGVFAEYWDVMQSTDVLSITVKNLDARRKGTSRSACQKGVRRRPFRRK